MRGGAEALIWSMPVLSGALLGSGVTEFGRGAAMGSFLNIGCTHGVWKLLNSNPGTHTDLPNGFVFGVNSTSCTSSGWGTEQSYKVLQRFSTITSLSGQVFPSLLVTSVVSIWESFVIWSLRLEPVCASGKWSIQRDGKPPV